MAEKYALWKPVLFSVAWWVRSVSRSPQLGLYTQSSSTLVDYTDPDHPPFRCFRRQSSSQGRGEKNDPYDSRLCYWACWMMNLWMVFLAQYQLIYYGQVLFIACVHNLPLHGWSRCEFWKFIFHKVMYQCMLESFTSLYIALSYRVCQWKNF